MAKSRSIVVKVDGNRLLGMQAKMVNVDNDFVDVTSDSTGSADNGPWKKGLGSAGNRIVNLAGSGIFKDDAAINTFEDLSMSGDYASMVIEFENGDYITGDFYVSSLHYMGEQYGIQQYAIELDSVVGNSVSLTRYTAPPAFDYPAAVLADSPDHYYRLGEDTGVTAADSGSIGISQTYQGKYTLNQADLATTNSDGCVRLSSTTRGDQAEVAGSSLGSSWSFPVTLEALVKVVSFSGSNSICPIITTHYHETNYYGFWLYILNSGAVGIAFCSGGTISTTTRKNFTTITGLINPGQTYHIVGELLDTNTPVMYINGYPVSITYNSGSATSLDASGGTMSIGGLNVTLDSTTDSLYANAYIDEVAIYKNKALSASRVLEHYQQAFGI